MSNIAKWLAGLNTQSAKQPYYRKVLAYYRMVFPQNEYMLLKVIMLRRTYLQRVMSIRKKLMLLRELYRQKLMLWLIGKANVEELWKLKSQRELLKTKAKSYKAKIKKYAKRGYVEEPVENSRLLYNPYIEAYPLSNAKVSLRQKLIMFISECNSLDSSIHKKQLRNMDFNSVYHYLERASDLIMEMVFRGYDRKTIRHIAHSLFIDIDKVRETPSRLLQWLESELVIGKTYELE